MTKILCHITDEDHLFPDPTPQEEKMQEQADEERAARIDQITDEMKKDADVINDALVADNNLSAEIAEIIADYNFEVEGDYTSKRNAARALAMYGIEQKITAELRLMAIAELDE